MTLILHYAPDNASLCIRIALLKQGLPFQTRLVDRRARAQRDTAYLALNPHGLIPVLEAPDGPLFETAAILIWLDETHGDLLPPRGDPTRAAALSWLVWLSNSLHPALQILFGPARFVPPDILPPLIATTRTRIAALLDLAEAHIPAAPALDAYLFPMLRWLALYPRGETAWFDLARWPGLYDRAAAWETSAPVRAAAVAEGLGARPVTRPQPPNPPEGSPT
ncbi:glutathione S-transferase family protein [Wenxinia marina]|uniref:Wenxma_15, whole genome shotgun sequence n=1 Tax=Wenxinia marina DSM 24838 TaxID=1123501 RepID=A0A0D0NIP6_9RHOB|nr:glutathione S-transferase family protein [Wenxinia marina]KIQ68180.1 Glutathione S-transferase [Wenxinia marina DSM 24838]GGL76555.1 glutathione S-transferase [Wenxinia marina]